MSIPITLRTSLVVRSACVAAVLVLQACSTPQREEVPSQADPIADRLQQGLTKVGSLPDFTRSADRKSPAPALEAPTITASFHGDAAQLLRSVALARGKELRIRGPKPHLPLVVHVDAFNVPYEDFLKDVGYQFGQRADLVLSDGHIEIRYRGQP